MRAYGSDRLRMQGERIILFSPIPKNWVPRVEKTLTNPEHPGTAVSWDGEFYEVIAASQAGSSVRYELEAWKEVHMIRVVDVYDEATEQQRVIEHRKAIARGTKRKAANFIGMLTGYLPATVQNEMASELGITPNKLTALSGVLSLAIAAMLMLMVVGAIVASSPNYVPSEVSDVANGEGGEVPGWAFVVGGFLLLETLIRFFILMSQGRPVGSVLGFIGYTLFWLIAPNRSKLVSPFEAPKGERLFVMEQPEHVVIADKLTLWSPLLTLLTPDEQRKLTATCGYDYRLYGMKVAVFILVFALIGVGSSIGVLNSTPRVSAFVSLAVALVLAIEQILRISTMRRAPAGSILGFLVRPFMRDLLERR